MKQTKITMNLDGLEDIKKAVGSSMRARVGIIGTQAAQNHELKKVGFKENRAQGGGTITNAELGLIMIFGSITNNIPPADFLLMPIELKKREILKEMGGAQAKEAFAAKDFKKLFQILGVVAESFVQEAFETNGFGTWPQNAQSTIARKGSSQRNIDTSELRKSISSDVVSNSTAPPGISTSVGAL